MTEQKMVAQERIDRPDLEFNKKSEVIDSSVGWKYDEILGKWESSPNKIPKRIMDNEQNFKLIEARGFNFEGSEYLLIIILRERGLYKYPHIKADWYTYDEIVGFVFRSDEYEKLMSIGTGDEIYAEYIIEASQSISDSKNIENDISILAKTIQYHMIRIREIKPANSGANKKLGKIYRYQKKIFPVRRISESKIRFYIPENFYFTSPDLYYYTPRINFDKEYIETDYENFSKIFTFK